VFGGIEYVTAHSGWRNNQPKSAWRLQKKHGGGVMMDMGPYSIQGARYSVGEEPLSVTAQEYKRNPQRFDEVDEIVTMQMEFPGGAVANLFTSFHTYTDLLHLRAEKGGFDLSPFWAYRNLKGKSTLGPIEFDQVNQQVLQMDEIAYRIENKMPMLTPGEEGLRDMIIIEGVFESIKTGKKILLNVS
jgi:glucose-fructose oxidoreductase